MNPDVFLLLHGLWVLFMLLGFPLAWLLHSRGLRLVHAVGLGFYVLLAVLNWPCPLTLAEEAARQAAHPGFAYHGSFLSSWVERLIYVQAIPLWVFHVLGGVYLAVVISSWWWWPRAEKSKSKNNIHHGDAETRRKAGP